MPILGLSEGVERGAFVATFLLGALMLGLGPGRSHVSIMTVFAIGALTWAGALFESVRRCAPDHCGRCDSGLPADVADQA